MSKLKNIGKSILISGIVVPAMGVVAHFMPGKGAFALDDASLSHRFETAYNFRVDPSHRHYTSYEYVLHNETTFYDKKGIQRPVTVDNEILSDSYIEPGQPFDILYREEAYACNPYVIYLLHLFVALGVYYALHRRDEIKQDEAYMRLMRMKQKSR